MSTLKDLEALLKGMPPAQKAEVDKLIASELAKPWRPNPGPQTEAMSSAADLLLYGGAAGGGKTDLLCGLALTEHERSVIFRRQAIDLQGFWDRLTELSPSNKQQDSVKRRIVTADGRLVETGHLDAPGAEMSWQGRPHDFIGFDEGAQLTAYKVNFVLGWLRSATGRRCRAVIATNPPIGGEGQWLLEWFAPWLDAAFDNPAIPGELRWAIVRGVGDEIRTVWVDGPEPVEMDGETYYPLSRTFIPSLLSDNPYLDGTNYRAQINAMPEPMRSQLLYGDFTAGREDDEYQVIPTAWIDAANDRWVANQGKRLPMTCLGVDVAQGGKDKTVLAPLHRHRFEDLIRKDGAATPDGPSVATQILSARRNDAVIVIDLTGGWGGSARDHLRTHHEIHAVPFVASEASGATTKDQQLTFLNMRAESWWKFREDLDPSTAPDIELPPDHRLKAQLTAPRWQLKGTRIQIESKDEIRKRLGSSTDDADAVIMAWANRGRQAYRQMAKSGRAQYAVEEASPFAGF